MPWRSPDRSQPLSRSTLRSVQRRLERGIGVGKGHELAHGPTFAHGLTKSMLHNEWAMSLDTAIDAEAQAQALCMMTEDFARAYRAFVDRQVPAFEGN